MQSASVENTIVKPLSHVMPPLDSIRFHVRSTHPGAQDCGGCVVLDVLVESIKDLGYYTTHHGCPMITTESNDSWVADSHLAIIYNEFDERCTTAITSRQVVHVHWLLAPVGLHTNALRALKQFHTDDLVFNYGYWVSDLPLIPVPLTNILFMQRNPFKGDDTDPNVLAKLPPVNRSGLIFSIRKGHRFHGPKLMSSDKKLPHEVLNISSTDGGRLNRDIIRQAEIFLTYDPYTYWTYKAAMWGAISIVYPVQGMTKEEWVESVCFGAYLKAHGLPMNFPGVAYGWEPSEIEHARRTMNELRPFIESVNEWGKTETLSRMIRDSYSHALGERKHFEGALLAKSFFREDLLSH
jgi:hypothetical protein